MGGGGVTLPTWSPTRLRRDRALRRWVDEFWCDGDGIDRSVAMEVDPFQSPKTTDAPQVVRPEPPGPGAPRIFAYLLAPPLATGVATCLTFMMTQDLAILYIIIVAAVSIWATVGFIRVVSNAYRGPSRVLLILGYLLGQPLVCFAVFFGACLWASDLGNL
jgi:hypothetical protein